MTTPTFKSRAMIRVETRLGEPLEGWLADRYRSRTHEQIADELGLSTATISRWMRELNIESRLPGQRPPEGAAA